MTAIILGLSCQGTQAKETKLLSQLPFPFHKQELHHSSHCCQLFVNRTISALPESSPTGTFLFLRQVHLFTLGPLLKQAKQLRAFCVKCLLPSYLTCCHSVLPGNEAGVIKEDYSKELTKNIEHCWN